MPGVMRPQTFVDVIGSVVDQSEAPIDSAFATGGLGQLAEVDEGLPLGDSATTRVAVTATWDNGEWGSTTWS